MLLAYVVILLFIKDPKAKDGLKGFAKDALTIPAIAAWLLLAICFAVFGLTYYEPHPITLTRYAVLGVLYLISSFTLVAWFISNRKYGKKRKSKRKH